MTLRARLTAAFLTVVLGPVLLGAVFVAVTASGLTTSRTVQRLDLAGNAVRGAVDAVCQQLRVGAQSAAVLSGGGQNPAGATQVVAEGLATAIRLDRADGSPILTTDHAPAAPWADCDRPTRSGRYPAIAARVEMRDPAGAPVGYAYAVRPVDAALLGRLAGAAGASVTLLDADPLSTERADRATQVATVAATLRDGATGRTADGRYVRRLDPTDGQPLPLAVSVARPDQRAPYLVLIALVGTVAAVAIVVAWWLAQGTTKPLAELAAAADRVAAGDLSARVPVRNQDEIGRLGGAFNRMTREMQAYVEALTASRDQLRGHLGVLGDTLSSTHDLDRILEVILATARAVTGAQSGVVLLVSGDALVGSGMRIPLGAGLLGAVAAGGEARRGRVGQDGMLCPEEPDCRTYVVVPLRGPDSVRGVLAVYDRLGDDEFDDADLVTLRTFAGQAAIAVENVWLHEEAQRLSHTDPLTGLYNYRTLKDSLRREVERANRFGHKLCVLVLDLDRFKEVNDSYGHAAGDAVLVEFARRVRAEIREVDLAFRQGGEEFVLLLPETDAMGGITVAQRLGEAIRATPTVVPAAGLDHGRRVMVTVSIGIAVLPEHGATGAQVLAAADDALYAAKAAGRDTYRLAGSRAATSSGTAAAPALPSRGAGGGVSAAGAGSGASGGPHPPRQPRGR